MKNNINKILFLAFLTIFVACNDDDQGPGNDQNLNAGFVEISAAATSAETVVLGNSAAPSVIQVPVILSQGLNPTDLTIDFTIISVSGQNPNTILQVPATGTIPAGFRDGSIDILVPEGANEALTENMVFDVTLTGVSGRAEVSLGLPDDSRNLTHRVTVAPINLRATYTGTSSIDGVNGGGFTATLTPVPNEVDTWMLDTTWGGGLAGVSGSAYPTILRLDREALTITVEGTDPTLNPNFQVAGDGTEDIVVLPFNSMLAFPGTLPLEFILDDDDDETTPVINPSTYDPVTDTFSFELTQFFVPGDPDLDPIFFEVVEDDETGVDALSFFSVVIEMTGNN